MLHKTEKEHLYRDSETNALLNKDMVGLEAYKKKKKRIEDQKNLSKRIDILEDKFDIMLGMLNQLIKEK